MVARARKRSASITLVLIGAAALAGCGQDDATGRRSQYATREACLADWGDPKDCEEVAQNSSSGPRHSFWYGPSHSGSTSRSSSGSSSSSSRSSSSGHSSGSVSRGGFGSSGHSHSSAS